MGSVYHPSYTKTLPDGTRHRVYAKNWYIRYCDAFGRLIRRKIGPDRVEAERELAEANAQVAVQRRAVRASGYNRIRHKTKPVAKHGIDVLRLIDSGMIPVDMGSLRLVSGVYFLALKGEVVYVGQSQNVMRRIAYHLESKLFDAAFYIPTAPDQMNETEAYYIRVMQPRYNRDAKGKTRLGWLPKRGKGKGEVTS